MRARMEEIYELHAEICQALSDPKRILIVTALKDGRRAVGDLANSLDLRQSTISQHLALLKQRGMVDCEREGACVYYYLTYPEVLEALDILRDILMQQLAKKKSLHEFYEQNL